MSYSDNASLIFLLLGVFAWYTEFAFPKFAAMNPMSRWFPPYGPPASRFSRLIGGTSCILIGLSIIGIIPKNFHFTIGALIATSVLVAAVLDINRVFTGSTTEDRVLQDPPVSKNRAKKLRKKG